MRMKPSPLFVSLLLLLCSTYEFLQVNAARLPLRGGPKSGHAHHGRLHRRAGMVGNTSVSDVSDIDYTTDIVLGGRTFTVQIDTGSSDLWVAGSVPNTKQTGRATKVQYAVDAIEGSILTAPLDFAGYTVDDQAFINVSPSRQNPDATGLIGLGPNTGSQVRVALGSSAGDAVLDRIFRQNTSTPNYITVLLGRTRDPTDPPTGELTVGEIIPGYEQVTSQPKLPVSVLSSDNSANQHWQVLLDSDGVIGPAGDNVIDELNVKTVVGSTSNHKQLTVVLDTGYSLPQVPPAVAEAFYSKVPGASLVNRPDLGGQIWQIPCDKEVNVTFKFGGAEYPIHPLDTNLDMNLMDSGGRHVCIGAFQPMNPQDGATYDMIFGMAFLRNTYTYINFGDFVDGSASSTAAPYVQLLSTTNNSAEAHADFLKVRGDSPWKPEAVTLAQRLRSRLPLIIGLSAAAGAVLLIAAGACCFFAARKSTRQRMAFFRSRKYRPLHDPAPPVARDLHLVDQPVNQPADSNPWDARY